MSVGGEESEIQAINFEQYELSRLVRVTFYDCRNALKCFQYLQRDDRFSVVLDLRGGSNRSVVIPKLANVSLDTLVAKFSQYGEVEKIWFMDKECTLVVDYFDARSPLKILNHLEDHAAALQHSDLRGILSSIY